MIDHKNKIIFIHIPKCAGSSVEILFGVKPKKYDVPDYERLVGWCPKRKIHLQHATAKQLLELDLVKEEIWSSYKKFSIVRNPFDRCISDYFWIMSSTGIRDSFRNFLLKKGKFLKVLNDRTTPEYRGDHLLPQNEYIYINNKLVVDHLLRFEELKEGFPNLMETLGFPKRELPKTNKSKKIYKHYSHFYNSKDINIIEYIYKNDLERFNYRYEMRKTDKTIFDTIKIETFKTIIRYLK